MQIYCIDTAIQRERVMAYWQGLVTGAALVGMAAVLMGTARPQKFGTIDVERINVREADGTLRLVISNKGRFPGSFHRGQEVARPDRRFAAGMLFLNDEGTENGGLIWAGEKDGHKRNSGASLTFDRYENDQTLQLLQNDDGDRDIAAMVISDRGAETMFEKVGGKSQLKANIPGGAPRLFVGKSRDRASIVMLQDATGVPRLMMKVDADGDASIGFLDAKGNLVRKIGPEG